MSRIPIPPGLKQPTEPLELKEDFIEESDWIVKTTLKPIHRNDPNVLAFVKYYLMCRDVRQAATLAGIRKSDGTNLLARQDIHEAIRKVTESGLDKYGYNTSEIVERVKEVANVDPLDFENPDGSFKTHMRDIAPESRRAIKKFKAKNIYELDPNGMKVVVGQLIEVEMWDKLRAVELLGREKDIFKESKKVTVELSQNMSSVLLDSRKRAEEAVAEMRDVSVPMIEHKEIKEEKE